MTATPDTLAVVTRADLSGLLVAGLLICVAIAALVAQQVWDYHVRSRGRPLTQMLRGKDR